MCKILNIVLLYSLFTLTLGKNNCTKSIIQFPKGCNKNSNQKNLDLEDRIVDGEICRIGEFPFMISIQVVDPTDNLIKKFCGGTIINEQVVLTAAHCIHENSAKQIEPWFVRAGICNAWECTTEAQTVKVAKKVPHENYLKETFQNDIGLLFLESPLIFNQFVNRAYLPNENYIAEETPLGYALGWGGIKSPAELFQSNELKKIVIPIKNLKECEQEMDNVVTENNICIGSSSYASGPCKGDSGGPYIQFINEVPAVVGVCSWGHANCELRPVVYTRVAKEMVLWIAKTMSKHGIEYRI